MARLGSTENSIRHKRLGCHTPQTRKQPSPSRTAKLALSFFVVANLVVAACATGAQATFEAINNSEPVPTATSIPTATIAPQPTATQSVSPNPSPNPTTESSPVPVAPTQPQATFTPTSTPTPIVPTAPDPTATPIPPTVAMNPSPTSVPPTATNTPPTSTPEPSPTPTAVVPTATPVDEINQELAIQGNGIYATNCARCHSTAEDRIVGPGHRGVYETAKTRVEGLSAEEYLIQSIVDPGAYVITAYPPFMPSFSFFTDEQIAALVEYLKTL